jgi:hypothetical protein
MNAKLWQTLVGFSYITPLFFLAAFFLPADLSVAFFTAMIVAVMPLGLAGAWFAILLSLGKLRFDCPFCWTRSPVVGADKRNLYLECPNCGQVCVTSRPFRSSLAAKVTEEEGS